jgi:DNA-binding MarR family transcriptional regulator
VNSHLPAPRWQELLIAINRLPPHSRYVEKVYKRIQTSKTHVRAMVKQLHIMGLIDVDHTGRRKPLRLTEKGEAVLQAIATVKLALNS